MKKQNEIRIEIPAEWEAAAKAYSPPSRLKMTPQIEQFIQRYIIGGKMSIRAAARIMGIGETTALKYRDIILRKNHAV